MRRRLQPLGLLIVALALFGCSARSSWPSATRTAPPAIPAYPQAQQERTRAEPMRIPGGTWEMRITTFHTADSPATVIAFYRDYLLARGWKQSGQVHFDNKEACPLYSFEISTSAAPADRTATQVELRLVPEPCSDR